MSQVVGPDALVLRGLTSRTTLSSIVSLKVAVNTASLRFSSNWPPSSASRCAVLVADSAARPRLLTLFSAAMRAANRTRCRAVSSALGNRVVEVVVIVVEGPRGAASMRPQLAAASQETGPESGVIHTLSG